MNEIGDCIWQQLDTFRNISDIVDFFIQSLFEDADYSEIYNDVEYRPLSLCGCARSSCDGGHCVKSTYSQDH